MNEYLGSIPTHRYPEAHRDAKAYRHPEADEQFFQ